MRLDSYQPKEGMGWIAGTLLLAAVDRTQKSNVMQLTNQGKQPLERQRLLRLLFTLVSLGILRTARSHFSPICTTISGRDNTRPG